MIRKSGFINIMRKDVFRPRRLENKDECKFEEQYLKVCRSCKIL